MEENVDVEKPDQAMAVKADSPPPLKTDPVKSIPVDPALLSASSPRPVTPAPTIQHSPSQTGETSRADLEAASVVLDERVGEGESSSAAERVEPPFAHLPLSNSVSEALDTKETVVEEVAQSDRGIMIETVASTSYSAASYLHTPPDDNLMTEHTHTTTVASTSQTVEYATPLPPQTAIGAPSKPKQKRKRNAAAGPSRPLSNVTPPIEPGDRPPHYLGEDNTIIRCICGIDEDDGFTIQCEICGAWEHGLCFGYLDEASAPEVYLCELCAPRPVDPEGARRRQLLSRGMTYDPLMLTTVLPEKEKDKEREKGRGKGKSKRQRMDSVQDAELLEVRDPPNELSPAAMGPPVAKPKRRQGGNKPRSAKQATVEPPSRPSTARGSLPAGDVEEDDFFRLEPWTLEFTPIRENVVRGAVARQTMRRFYQEWADEEDEQTLTRKRSIENPSGLPSPADTGVVRLSPETLFAAPEFGVTAPPVPPVFLSGQDLDSLGMSTSIQPILDSQSYLPLTYTEVASAFGVYNQPAIYGVFSDEAVPVGTFVGEYSGEVLDCESYRKDPINQYSGLGMPKPFVRSIGPPVNLIVDSRGYGCNLRFIRSSCHPNVVLRPFFWRNDEASAPKLKLGVFTSTTVGEKDELSLGWEWDDQHIVHALRTVIHPAMSSDGSLATPDFSVPEDAVRSVASKFDSVLTHLFGTFTSCACRVLGNCALAQMKHVVEYVDGLDDGRTRHPVNGRRTLRADLGELVGAVRGWRRRELEVQHARRWDMPDDLLELAKKARLEHRNAGDGEGDQADKMDIDDDNHRDSDREVHFQTSANDSLPIIREHSPPPTKRLSSPMKASAAAAGDTDRFPSSSSLSSAPPPSSAQPELDDPESGDESDATTATIPKSEFSDDDRLQLQHIPVAIAGEGKAKRQGTIVSLFEDGTPIGKVKLKVAKEDRRPMGLKKQVQQGQGIKGDGVVRKAAVGTPGTGVPPGRMVKRTKKRVVSSDLSDEDEQESERDRERDHGRRSGKANSRTKETTRQAPPQGSDVEMASGRSSPVKAATNSSPVKAASAIPASQSETEPAPGPEHDLPSIEPDPPPRDPTPPPRVPTPPPPEPLKKVSMIDYVKNLKLRKGPLVTPASETAPTETSETPTPTPLAILTQSPAEDATSIPGFGQLQSASANVVVKPEPDSASGRVNHFEHLPTRNGSMTSAAESPRPPPTPSAYVPRDYFPPQAPAPAPQLQYPNVPVQAQAPQSSTNASAYVPRQYSSSYTPRQTSFSLDPNAANGMPMTPGGMASASPVSFNPDDHLPRTPASTTPVAAHLPLPRVNGYGHNYGSGAGQGGITPPAMKAALPEIPHPPSLTPSTPMPPVAQRDLPPHALGSTPSMTPSATPAHSLQNGDRDRGKDGEKEREKEKDKEKPEGWSRPPPTGPKVPPTGPRGSLSSLPTNPTLGSGPGSGPALNGHSHSGATSPLRSIGYQGGRGGFSTVAPGRGAGGGGMMNGSGGGTGAGTGNGNGNGPVPVPLRGGWPYAPRRR